MNTVKEAIDHYLPKKLEGELSLVDIRKELNANTNFSEEQINEICSTISDEEIAHLNRPKKPFSLDFVDNNIFSGLMIVISVAIFIYSFIDFQRIQQLEEIQPVDDVRYFIPGFFMLGSLIFLVRHLVQIIKRVKNKNT